MLACSGKIVTRPGLGVLTEIGKYPRMAALVRPLDGVIRGTWFTRPGGRSAPVCYATALVQGGHT